jgi:hypothetical protein
MSYMVCTVNDVAMNLQWARKKKEGGLHGGRARRRRRGVGTPEKKRGYMVCTGNYVATNTRKQKRAARSSAENRLSPKGGPPRESLCV